ncbi:Aste57867_1369 [Aphanomyces stellatus]|uniref:Aste57867_1369 protein n=1 Tax=Aphanomyces stellatus TaxID=120398 RepID=A0A485KA54_9STRA|nr:hypothetical protein As57867_001368 [Aphanomyces stellatus]VFT78587.1 Aste57867_1369 [Aphanomyces stellatus]
MAQIYPTVDLLPRRDPLHRVAVWSGLLYVGGSLVSSGLYLMQVHPSVSNDYWWPGFNTSGIQTYVGDVFNAYLLETGTLPLVIGVFRLKSYASPATVIEWSPSAGRQRLLTPIALAKIIPVLRVVSFDVNMDMQPAYCWLDLNRAFDMAHTAKRQVRCFANERTNGVVYMELLLRNLPTNAFAMSQWANAINASIITPLQLLPNGPAWLATIQSHAWLSIQDEVDYWMNHGINTWINNLQNLNQDGIDDSISIQNALGYAQSVRTKKLPMASRGLASWTTMAANIGIFNDFNLCKQAGCSLIRQSNNSVNALGWSWDVDFLSPTPTVGVQLVRRFIGPLAAIDIKWVPKPQSLLELVQSWQTQLLPFLTSNVQTAVTVDPIPVNWMQSGTQFYGGNPMCLFGVPQPYVQPSFGYYDDCTAQVPNTIELSGLSMLFAMQWMSPLMVPTICQLCQTSTRVCLLALSHILPTSAPPLLAASTTAIQATSLMETVGLNISIMQMVTRNGTNMVLTQPLVDATNSDPWSFFGWVMVYEWLIGQREVYHFEGDEGTVTLMSQIHPPLTMAANPLELPQHACNYIWYISVYVTFVLACVGVVVWLYAVAGRFDCNGSNLFQFNRVVGSVWIGRPMLFLRGMTALVVLSTASVSFDAQNGIVSTFAATPMSFWTTCLVAGEATWITYVIQDVLLPLSHGGNKYAHVSSVLTWAVLVVWNLLAPVQLSAFIDVQCTIVIPGVQLTCHSGVVSVGSWARLIWFLGSLVGILASVMLVVRLFKLPRDVPASTTPAACVSAAAEAYFTSHRNKGLDDVASVMTGLLHGCGIVFDIKLWYSFKKLPRQTVKQTVVLQSGDFKVFERPTNQRNKYSRPLRATLGLGYLVATLVGSYGYLSLTQATMANDFWWDGFNATGHQAFLAMWFNNQLHTTNLLPATRLDSPAYSDFWQRYDKNTSTIVAASLYAANIQSEVNTLSAVVTGLRTMDSCQLPWISAAYCFVDFAQRWSVAVSADRQLKCQQELNDGANFLESLFRNANWRDLMVCWGDSLEQGIFAHLGQTSEGNAWIHIAQSNSLSIAQEVGYWASHNITVFTPQWQNFKRLGVVETFSIQNAFGLDYPLTLKRTKGEFQLPSPTSFRMQWPLANLLWSVTSNATSGVGGASLIRTSSRFAFGNRSVETVLIRNGTVPSPWTYATMLTRTFLGPFGTITMKRMSPPPELKALYQETVNTIHTALATNHSALPMLINASWLGSFRPQPVAWKSLWHHGGNCMCEINGGSRLGINNYFTSDGRCSSIAVEDISPSKLTIMAALLATDSHLVSNDTCSHELLAPLPCRELITTVYPYLKSVVVETSALQTMARAVKSSTHETLRPQFMQYIYDPNSRKLYFSVVDVFDNSTFEFFAWLYMFDWVTNSRELVRFDGETNGATLVSGARSYSLMLANPEEIPVNVAFYIRSVLEYVTFVLMCVAGLACFSVVLNRGHIEGWNMFEFNRVTGLVWIGRPLLVLRGVTAICLLSTATLMLTRPENSAYVSQFQTQSRHWLTTLLSSGEICWFVYVVNDLFSIATQQFTSGYAIKCTSFVYLSASIWSFVQPVQHDVAIDRCCTIPVVDFQVDCTSGTLAIGRFSRFYGLVLLAAICCLVAFVVERWLQRGSAPRLPSHSYLLHASARYHFDHTEWIVAGTYHLDRASAVLNGVLALPIKDGRVVALDIKSWRIMVSDPSIDAMIPLHLQHAIAVDTHTT